jgi:hypothetical protein
MVSQWSYDRIVRLLSRSVHKFPSMNATTSAYLAQEQGNPFLHQHHSCVDLRVKAVLWQDRHAHHRASPISLPYQPVYPEYKHLPILTSSLLQGSSILLTYPPSLSQLSHHLLLPYPS